MGGQAEPVSDAGRIALGHDLGSTIVPVAADSDVGIGPITAQVTHQASDVPRRLLSRRRLACAQQHGHRRSEEHTSELQSLMRISYAVFCLKKKTKRLIKLQPHEITN